MPAHKQFVVILALAFFSTASLVAGFNFFVDPANLFGHNKLGQQIAENFSKGLYFQSITGLPYDDRALQKSIIGHMAKVPSVVVLGSSRASQIRQDFFPRESFFNSWVGSAVIEDYYSIVQLYVEKGGFPKTIYMGVDPWLFNKRNNITKWTQLRNEFTIMVRRAKLDLPRERYDIAEPMSPLSALISTGYLVDSAKLLYRMSAGGELAYEFIDNEASGKERVFRPDGSYRESLSLLHQSAAQVREESITMGQKYGFVNCALMDGIDEFYARALDSLVRLLRDEGVNVYFVISPLHPAFYQVLLRHPQYRLVRDSETVIRDIAERRDVPLLGSFSAAEVGCREEEFIDGHHPTESCMRKVIRR